MQGGSRPGPMASTRLLYPALLLLSCAPEHTPPADAPPDLLLVTVDTLRADHVSAFGVFPGLTPHLDGLAARGVLFERHHATSGLTAPSMASLLTGALPHEHRVTRNGLDLERGQILLTAHLAEAGYRCIGASGSLVVSGRFGFDRGFDDFTDPDELTVEQLYAPGELVVDRLLERLAEPDPRPVFAWVHLMDPHTPYLRGPDELEPLDAVAATLSGRLEPSERYAESVLLELYRSYRAEVRYADRQLGRLLEAWDRRPGPSVVAVTGDHGEGLGEHGFLGHGLYVYQEQLHVPLVLAGDGLPSGRRVEEVTSMVDLGATLLDATGAGTAALGRGRSMLPLLDGVSPHTERTAFATRRSLTQLTDMGEEEFEDLLSERAGGPGGERGPLLVAVRSRFKLILEPGGLYEAYDLERDPDEHAPLEDLTARGVAPLVDELGALLVDFVEHNPGKLTNDREVLEHLEALGYR